MPAAAALPGGVEDGRGAVVDVGAAVDVGIDRALQPLHAGNRWGVHGSGTPWGAPAEHLHVLSLLHDAPSGRHELDGLGDDSPVGAAPARPPSLDRHFEAGRGRGHLSEARAFSTSRPFWLRALASQITVRSSVRFSAIQTSKVIVSP